MKKSEEETDLPSHCAVHPAGKLGGGWSGPASGLVCLGSAMMARSYYDLLKVFSTHNYNETYLCSYNILFTEVSQDEVKIIER